MDKNSKIPPNIFEAFQDDTCFGRMNDASGAAYVKGLCGDEMEFYLVVKDNIAVEDLKYLPQDYIHCSILAVSTLHRAVADYLLKP